MSLLLPHGTVSAKGIAGLNRFKNWTLEVSSLISAVLMPRNTSCAFLVFLSEFFDGFLELRTGFNCPTEGGYAAGVWKFL